MTTIKIKDIVNEVIRFLRQENIPFTVEDLVFIAAQSVLDLTTLKPVLVKRFWLNSKYNKQRYYLPPEIRQVLSVWYKPSNASFLIGHYGLPDNYFVVLGSPEWNGWDKKGTLVWFIKSGQGASPKPYKVKFQTSPFGTTIDIGSGNEAIAWRSRTPEDAFPIPRQHRCAPYRSDDDFELGLGGENGDLLIDTTFLYIHPSFDVELNHPPYQFDPIEGIVEGTIVEEDNGWIELEPIGATEAYFPSNALTDSPVLSNDRGYGVFGNVLVIQYPIRKNGFRNIMVEAVCVFPEQLRCCTLQTDTGISTRYLRLLIVMTLRRVLESTIGQGGMEWILQLLKEEQLLLETVPTEMSYLNQPMYGASILPYGTKRYMPSTENHEEWDFVRLGYWKPTYRSEEFMLSTTANLPSSTYAFPIQIVYNDKKVFNTVGGVRQTNPFTKWMKMIVDKRRSYNDNVEIRVPKEVSSFFPDGSYVVMGGNNVPITYPLLED